MSDILGILWGLVVNLIETINDVWYWVSSPQFIGVDLGILGSYGLDFVPIHYIGGGILLLLVLWLVKALLPLT